MKLKRKISIRKILQVFTTLVVTAACVVAIAGASKIDGGTTVKNVQVHIKNDKKYHFIEQNEIMDLAINKRNIDLAHTPLSQLDIRAIEQVITADPWVANAEVFVDNTRTLHIYVTQRIPVARVFQQNSVSYYMDTTMTIMPLSEHYIYYTSVVTNVPEIKNDSISRDIRKQIVAMVRAIQADSFWNAQISQVIVDSAGMFELVPVLGEHRIIFGDASRIKEKLDNLFAFYKNVLNRIGWDKYQALDLRFKGQVIASPSLPYKGPVDKAVVNMNWINSILQTEAKKDSVDSARVTGSRSVLAPKPVITPVKKTEANHNVGKNVPNAAKKDTNAKDKKKQADKKKMGKDKHAKKDDKKHSVNDKDKKKNNN